MIGRAAVGNPWIFKQIKDGLDEVTPQLIKEVVLEHYDQMIEYYEEYGAVMFRKNLHSYSKAGYKGASIFRDTLL
jgi:tRNA-dihydrouridine synthase B